LLKTLFFHDVHHRVVGAAAGIIEIGVGLFFFNSFSFFSNFYSYSLLSMHAGIQDLFLADEINDRCRQCSCITSTNAKELDCRLVTSLVVPATSTFSTPAVSARNTSTNRHVVCNHGYVCSCRLRSRIKKELKTVFLLSLGFLIEYRSE